MAIRKIERKNGIVYQAYFKFKGKQYQKVFYTKKEASAWEMNAKKSCSDETTMPQSLMFSLASKSYLQDCKVRLARNTFHENCGHLREYASFLGQDITMADVTKATASMFIRHVEKERGGKAADRRIRTLRALWNWHSETLPYNPWRYVTKPAMEEYVKYVPTPADVGKVLSVAEPWQADLLNALLHTGARVGEILNLTWEDVSKQSLKLWTRKRRGGSRQYRELPMDTKLCEILTAQKAVTGNNTHVFVNPRTGEQYAMHQPAVRDMMKRLCEKAEVKHFGFHAIRHFFAISLIQARRAGLADIQRLLGHQRATITDIYLKSVAPDLDHLAEIIEASVQPIAPRKGLEQADD